MVTTDLNPSDFSYCPPSASDSGRPRMELDLALFSRLMGGGWGNGDTYTISSQSSGVAVFSGTFSSSPSTVSLKVRPNVIVELAFLEVHSSVYCRNLPLACLQDATL